MKCPASIFLAAAYIVACSPPPELPQPLRIGGEDGPISGTCEARVATMREVLALIPRDPRDASMTVPEGLQLIPYTGGNMIGDGVPLVIHANGSFQFGDVEYADFAALKGPLIDQFANAAVLAKNLEQPFAATLLLLFDARAPITALPTLTAALPREVSYGLLVTLVDDRVPAPPPTPAWAQAALAPTDTNERTMSVADAADRAIGGCESVRKVFAAVTDAPADDRTTTLVDRLPAAVHTCGCEGVDVEALTAIVWGMHGQRWPRTRVVPIPISHDPKAERLELPGTMTAKDLAALLNTRDRLPFRLAPTPTK